MARTFFSFSILSASLILGGALPTIPAKAQSASQALHLCKASNTPDDKIRFCTIAMRYTADPRVLERLYLRRGNSFMELKRYGDAVGDFTKLIQINPTVAGYFDNRLAALSALGLNKEALADANTEVSLAANKAFVFRSRGLVLENLLRYDAAIRDFDHAIDVDPANNGLVVDRARIKTKAGRPSEAISDLSRIISIEPSNLVAYKERGIAYAAIGNFGAAESDLLFYARAAPNDAEVARAIEEMNAGRSVGRSAPQPSPPPPDAAAPSPPKSEKAEEEKGGIGTGFFISPQGYIVTNAHVVKGCSVVQAASGINFRTDARVLATDTANDLALLKVETKPAAWGQLRSGVKTGENIAAFGYPLYGLLTTTGNFTVGNVSAVAGIGDDTRYLQISAPIQPGNSGGPVLDQSGNVVGVVVSKLNVLKVASAIDDVPQNVNFAIKTSVVSNFLDSTGIAAQPGDAQTPLSSSDLAEKAKAISVVLKCSP